MSCRPGPFKADRRLVLAGLLWAWALAGACGEDAPRGPLVDLGLTPAGFARTLGETAPADNQLTEARAQLGKRLFFDPILSADRTISCGSCHKQAHAFADPRRVSEGVGARAGRRNAAHLVNLAWVQTGLFWDGRAASLEEQAGKPIEDPLEMNLPHEKAVARLLAEADYIEAFQSAYGAPPRIELVQKALASFVRSLVSVGSRYDRYLAGEVAALNASEQRGVSLFLDSRTGCFHCHSQATLTNDGFFNNGTSAAGGDAGRQTVTGRSGDFGKFRVPSLRNVEVTAPYMHDGSVPSLEAVVEQYAQGGRGHPRTDAQVHKLDLSEADKADLVAFLRSLTDWSFLQDRRFKPPN